MHALSPRLCMGFEAAFGPARRGMSYVRLSVIFHKLDTSFRTHPMRPRAQVRSPESSGLGDLT